MGGEHGDRALGDVLLVLDEHGAAVAQLGDDVLVVHDLLADVDRRAVQLERSLDRLHGAIDARAVAARGGKEDLLDHRRLSVRAGGVLGWVALRRTWQCATTSSSPPSARCVSPRPRGCPLHSRWCRGGRAVRRPTTGPTGRRASSGGAATSSWRCPPRAGAGAAWCSCGRWRRSPFWCCSWPCASPCSSPSRSPGAAASWPTISPSRSRGRTRGRCAWSTGCGRGCG